MRSLLTLAYQAAWFLIVASVLLTMIGAALRPRWWHHPAVRLVVGLGDALCAPVRKGMERIGIPTRPLDFSPMVALFSLQVLYGFLMRIF